MPPRVERAARWLIARHPSSFVEQFADDMLQTFHTRAADAHRRGRIAFAWFVVREFAAIAGSLVSSRLPRRPRLGPVAAHGLREGRHAARRLLSTPSFTAAAVVTLTLAIGSTAAVFTLLHRIVLAPLPYADAEQLIDLDHAAPGVGLLRDVGMSSGLYREYGKLPTLHSIAIYHAGEATLTGHGEATLAEFIRTTPSLARVLRIEPALGRWFHESEGVTGAPKVAILTHRFWRQRFGASPAVIGSVLKVDGEANEIVGVLPAGLDFPDPRVDFVLPLPLDPVATRAAGFNYAGIARMTPGTSVDRARAEQDAVIADLANRFPADNAVVNGLLASSRLTSLAAPLKDHVLGRTAVTLWVLLWACALVLLLASANIANLFLVRAEARSREVVLRSALGAGRGAMAAYYLSEAMLLSLVSGALGLLLAAAAVELLVRSAVAGLPRLHEVRIDATVVAVTALASLVSGVLFGALPSAHRMISGARALHATERATSGGRAAARIRHALMAVQVALAVVLLVAAGLMIRSFTNLLRVDPGFRADSHLVFRIGLPRTVAESREDALRWQESMIQRLQSLPGITRVAVGSSLPLLSEGQGDPIEVRGRPRATAEAPPVVRFRRVSVNYFETLSIPLQAGRWFDAADAAGRTDNVIVDQGLARLYFPNGDAIGQRIRPFDTRSDDRWLTIVGLVGNTATTTLHDSAGGKMYVPLSGSMWADIPSARDLAYVLETAWSPLASIPTVRQALHETSPDVAMAGVEPFADIIARSRAELSFAMILIVLAASVALILGVVGVYAVIAYGVAQRRLELAVRLALGATAGELTRMIVRQGRLPIVSGIAVGIVAASGASQLLRALLFGVSPGDPLVHGVVAAMLFAIGTVACWIPARRAARVSPIEGLRSQA